MENREKTNSKYKIKSDSANSSCKQDGILAKMDMLIKSLQLEI